MSWLLPVYGWLINGRTPAVEIYQHPDATPGTWQKTGVIVPYYPEWNCGYWRCANYSRKTSIVQNLKRVLIMSRSTSLPRQK